jgi:dGTPase
MTLANTELREKSRQVIGELQTVAATLESTGLEGIQASGNRRPLAQDAIKLNQTHAGWFEPATYVRALRSVLSWLSSIRESIAGVDPDSEDAKALIHSRFADELGQIIGSIRTSRREAWLEGPNMYPDNFQWHKVQVMKTLSQQYIIGSPTVSMHEQAQLSVLENLLASLLRWCTSVRSASQLPVRLRAYIVEMGLKGQLCDCAELRRAIVDYLCSLTDDECVDLQGRLTGLKTPIISKVY